MSPMVRILIIGGGRVGAPLAAWLTHKKNVESVSVCDTNPLIREWINEASFPWQEPGLNAAIDSTKKLFVLDDVYSIKDPSVFDMAFICVGTPVNDDGPQVAHIAQIARHLKGTQIILRSTVPPGTSNDLARLTGQPVIHAPERLLLGKGMEELDTLPQIIGVSEDESLFSKFSTALEFLQNTFNCTTIGTAVEAELAKICNNTVRYIEFAVGTELSRLMTYADADPFVVRTMMTKNYPRGRLAYPSFVGSYCLDKDWQMLAHRGLHSDFARLAFEFNQNLFKSLTRDLHLAHEKIGVLGLTYKPDLDDTRNSLTWELLKWLKEEGAHGVMVHDPLIDLTAEQEHEHGAYSVDSAQHVLATCDLIYVMTAHKEYQHLSPRADTIFIDPAGIINVGNKRDFVRSDE